MHLTKGSDFLAILHAQIFEDGSPFDYGVTLSDAVDMPVNLGMQFVPRGRYLNAIGFLSDVIAIYPFNETFIAGQVGVSAAPRLPQLTAHRAALPYAPLTCSAETQWWSLFRKGRRHLFWLLCGAMPCKSHDAR